MTHQDLTTLAHALATLPAIREKATIQTAYTPATQVSQNIPLGDDCAAIPDPATGGHLLFAAEGMLPSFVAQDPWFAGYSAVMVNLSDIAAMGGTPIAITDILWTPDPAATDQIWQGMQAASRAYNIPIVGGHTTYTGRPDHGTHLAAAILGRSGKNILTSFHTQPGDQLLIAIDMNGSFRRDKPFWNASTDASPQHLQATLNLLPQIADRQLAHACKDISNGGIVGTLAMLAHCSGVGAELHLDPLPIPPDTPLLKWLSAFPSYGYLLAVKEENIPALTGLFTAHHITTAKIGHFTPGTGLTLRTQTHTTPLAFPPASSKSPR